LGWFWCDIVDDLAIVCERLLYCEQEVLRERAFRYCKIFSCVRRSVLQLGVQEGERKREKREDLLVESADKNCMLYLNKS
jgi:hypothetical protein